MICPSCQHANSDKAKFCEECATRLVRKCAACGESLSPSSKFCPECGTPAGAPAAEAAPALTLGGSPASHVPKHLAEKILRSRSAVEGELKLVTILFADLKGSMEVIAHRDPEDAQRILDPLVSLMMAAVHDYEGTVSHLLGDGIMAIFGAPLAHEDHAVRACYAALRIQENVARLAAERLRTLGTELSVRVGLNSGEVVVRSIGTDLSMDYSAVGHTAHLASRMEQLADGGAILMAPATKRLVEGYVNLRPLGERTVKGLDQPVEVFEVLGVSAVRSRLLASVARGLTRFTGRDAELALIREALDRTKAGYGQAVAISGEAGIGKSRLIWEFMHSAAAEGCLVLEGGPAAFGTSVSYAPFADMLRGYFGIERLEAPAAVREQVDERVRALDGSLAPLLPGLHAILDVGGEDPDWRARDPQSCFRLILDGFRSLLLLESRRQPLILVFDDLHWIDEETHSLLDGLVDGLPMGPILLLCGHRPEFRHNWSRRSYFREIRVAPLATSSAEHLLDVVLGGDPKLKPLKELLIHRTDGNPFFLEESIRTLVEMKFIDGAPGAYRLLKFADTVRIPESARAILSARMDRLDEDDKWVLQAAAVIGKEVPFVLLKAISGIGDAALRSALDRLQSLEFLFETSLFPELKFSFLHALVQEVAYGTLLGDRRRALHATIVEAAEGDGSEPSLERLDRLAHHARQGALWEKAVDYSRQAGQRALKGAAMRQAAKYFQDALGALAKQEEARRDRRLEADLGFDLRAALLPIGRLEEARTVLSTSLAKAVEIGDRRRQGLANCYLTNLYWELGEQDKAIAAGREAEAIAEALADDDIARSARRYLGRSYQAIGAYKTALELLDRSLPKGRPVSPSGVLIRVFMSMCHLELGDFRDGIAFGEETVGLSAGLNNPLCSGAALSALGRIFLRRGEFEAAAVNLEKSLQLVEREDIPLLFPFSAAPLGVTYARLGRFDEGLSLLARAAEKAAEMKRMVDAPLWEYWQSVAFLLAGDLAAAKRTAERGLALSIRHQERGHQGWLLRMLGEVEEQTGDARKAMKHYRQALDLATELEMRPLIQRSQISIARLSLSLGKEDDGKLALSAARALGDEMGTAIWLGEAGRAA